jgi:release factor glutamine methyltransferase
MMKINEARMWGEKILLNEKVGDPRSSALFLLKQVLKTDDAHIISHGGDSLTKVQEKKYRGWIERRINHEPVWYITGKINFFNQELSVNNAVLIPRPETELMVERILKDLGEKVGVNRVLDLGTGSGAIILSLAKELSQGAFFASDISDGALRVARKNALDLKLSARISFEKGDLFTPWIGQKFDVITANLPYVPHEEMSSLAFDITHHEPRLALDGGREGLEVYERFFNELPFFLNENSLVYCEIGKDQGENIKKMVEKLLPEASITILSDYSSIDRIAIIKR